MRVNIFGVLFTLWSFLLLGLIVFIVQGVIGYQHTGLDSVMRLSALALWILVSYNMWDEWPPKRK